jgi:hypothetical protein
MAARGPETRVRHIAQSGAARLNQGNLMFALATHALRSTLISSAAAFATLLCTALPAHAEIAVYYEVNGMSLAGLTGNGSLTGLSGEYSGQNVSQIDAARWMGVENGAFHIMNSQGYLEHYYPYNPIAGTAYCCTGLTKKLSGGLLDGQAVQNANYLGATNDVMYYVDKTGTVVYSELGYHTVLRQDNWATLSGGGSLSGKSLQRGVGLLDMGGNTDLSDDYLMNVAPDGTLEYYYLPTGTYAAGLEPTYGSWKLFTEGKLGGLTLAQLAKSPVGSINGYSYHYMGNGDDYMYFDVSVAAVPEASTWSTLFLGLCLMVGVVRRRGAHTA